MSTRKRPPFVERLYEVVEDSATNKYIEWNEEGNGFTIHKESMDEFAKTILPKLCSSGSPCALVRQLNAYNFHRDGTTGMKFKQSDDLFHRGRPELLKSIKRRASLKRRAAGDSKSDSAADQDWDEQTKEIEEDVFDVEERKDSTSSSDGAFREHVTLRTSEKVALTHALSTLRTVVHHLSGSEGRGVQESLESIDRYLAAQTGRSTVDRVNPRVLDYELDSLFRLVRDGSSGLAAESLPGWGGLPPRPAYVPSDSTQKDYSSAVGPQLSEDTQPKKQAHPVQSTSYSAASNTPPYSSPAPIPATDDDIARMIAETSFGLDEF